MPPPKMPKHALRSPRRVLEAVRGMNINPDDPLAWLIWMPGDSSPRPSQILPASDTREHKLCTYTSNCWCEPTYTEEGILVHNAADGREHYGGVEEGVLQLKKN